MDAQQPPAAAAGAPVAAAENENGPVSAAELIEADRQFAEAMGLRDEDPGQSVNLFSQAPVGAAWLTQQQAREPAAAAAPVPPPPFPPS